VFNGHLGIFKGRIDCELLASKYDLVMWRFYLQFEVLSVCQIQLIIIHFMDNFASVGSYCFYKAIFGNKIFFLEFVTAFILAR
jgi:hypothetical protein